jgi:Tol biopolymer transport system component
MNKMFLMSIAALLIAALQTTRAQQGDAHIEKLLARAHHKATVDGDLTGAIEEYKRIVATADSRAAKAQALVSMAECYHKLGDAQATAVYRRVLREYPDQKDAVTVARGRIGGVEEARETGIMLRKVWDGRASENTAAVLTTVSRDGRRLSYIPFATGTVNLRDLVTGADRPVTADDFNAGPSVISSDGRHVAYEWYGGKHGSELRIVNVQGNGTPPFRRLYEGADVGQITPMDFSPDGATIAVTLVRKDRTKQIGLVNTQTGGLTVLKSVDWRGPTRIFFSPDGRDLAFDLPASESSFERDVFVLAADGSREIPTVVHPANDIVMGWSPDGRHLLFASDRRGGAMGLWALPFLARKAQGQPELVKDSIGSAWSMGVTSSGHLYLGAAGGDRDIAVASIDVKTGKQVGSSVKPITSFIGTNLQPAWSPDGKSLAYISLRSYNPVFNITRILAIRSAATGEVRELRPNLVYFNQLSWAPDGSALATGGTDFKGRDGVFRIDARTGEVSPIVLSDDASNAYPQWSRDGARIYYRVRQPRTREFAFIERELASGHEREIVRGDLGSISLSPDGKWIAAQQVNRATNSESVVVIPVSGGDPKELLRVSQPARVNRYTGMPWTPDGRGVLVRTRLADDSGELWLVPVGDEPAYKIDVNVEAWATGPVGVISLHPDGRQLAFLTGEATSEVWRLENFLPANTAKK